MPKISVASALSRRLIHPYTRRTSLFLLGIAISLGASLHANAAVHTPGKLSVSELGAATYTVPLAMPPGTAGMAPSLSLTFNSQSNGGLMGKGWSLSGLSSITRCAQTPSQDGTVLGAVQFNANDRFCLDGQRLVISNGLAYGANGAEYRTENDSFSKIIAYGEAQGPAWFKVWTKSGRVLEYGNTSDSRIEIKGKAEVRTWAVNREQDIKGNYLTFSYTEDSANGDFYPARIDYTGNANTGMATNNAVTFEYDPLPLVVPAYAMGAPVQATVRLKSISMQASGVATGKYKVSYLEDALTKRSRVETITQCNGSGANCLPPIRFDWQNPGTFSQTAGAWMDTGAPLHSLSGLNNNNFIAIDLNGDGKTDLVQQVEKDGHTWFLPMYSNGSGFTLGNWFDTGMDIANNLLVADVDGNGKSELVHMSYRYTNFNVSYTDFTRKITIFYPTETGFRIADGGTHSNATATTAYAMDVDGDGKTEIVEVIHDRLDNFSVKISISKFDGNYFSMQTWKKYDSRPSQISVPPLRYPLNVNFIPMDINGDGKMDLVQTWVEVLSPDNIWLRPIFSNGVDFSPGTWTDTGLKWRFLDWSGLPDAVESIIPLDMNGDGMMDLMLSGHAYIDGGGELVNLHPFYSNGINFIPGNKEVLRGIQVPSIHGGVNQPWPADIIATDINGDGKTDLLQMWIGEGPDLKNAELLIQPVISQGNGFLLDRPVHHTGQKWGTVEKLVLYEDYGYLPEADGPGLLVLDINGDGKMDLVQQKYQETEGGLPKVNVSLLPYLADSGIGDLMNAVTNGLGAKTTIRYTPLTDAATYVNDAATSYPFMNMLMPLYVVAAVDHPDGIGGYQTVKYRYGGLKKDASRGELVGFRWREEQQVSTGMTSRVEYRQDWPYAGMVLNSSTSLAGAGYGDVLSKSTATFGCIDTLDGTPCVVRPGRSYFPFVSESISQKWDLNGAVLPEQKSTTAYDIWGNATDSIASVSAGGKSWTTHTVNTFYPADQSKWLVGQLKLSTVSKTMPAYTGTALPSGDTSTPGGGTGGGNGGGSTPGAGMHASTVNWVAGFAPPAQSSPGRSVSLQVQVSGAATLAGTVTFFDGDTALAVIALDGAGKAGFSMPLAGIGTHALRAVYSGDANNASSSVGATVKVSIDLTPILMLLLDE